MTLSLHINFRAFESYMSFFICYFYSLFFNKVNIFIINVTR